MDTVAKLLRRRTCTVGTETYDTRIQPYADWIIRKIGPAYDIRACGNGPQSGEDNAPVVI